jgi:hypothetical protein
MLAGGYVFAITVKAFLQLFGIERQNSSFRIGF